MAAGLEVFFHPLSCFCICVRQPVYRGTFLVLTSKSLRCLYLDKVAGSRSRERICTLLAVPPKCLEFGTELAEIDLRETCLKYRKLRIRQHVNPLKSSFMVPATPPVWQDVYDDTSLPLMVDIGCGSEIINSVTVTAKDALTAWLGGGYFLVSLAKRFLGTKNFLGLEIRKKLVERAQNYVKTSALSNVHFMLANATISFGELIRTYPGPLTSVTILCPDPHFKKKHHKRRVLQKHLVMEIIKYLDHGGKVFLQSDVLELAIDMQEKFDEFASLKHVDDDLCDVDGWLLDNPFGIKTEREIFAEEKGLKIYRRMYQKL